jgi:MFS transporter, FHS family, L-fucose permease
MSLKHPNVAAPSFTRAVTSYRWALILVTCLFFLWGLSYGLLDVLNKHFQETLHVSKAAVGPAAKRLFRRLFPDRPARRPADGQVRLQGRHLAGPVPLCHRRPAVYARRCSAELPVFPLRAVCDRLRPGLSGNRRQPLCTVLGEPAGAERRLNLAQSFNGLGQFFGPLIGGALFFSGANSTDTTQSLQMTYLVIAALVLLVAILIARTPLPDLREQEVQAAQHDHKSLWQHREFVTGVITQFFYVGAQVGVGAFFINYVTEHWAQMSSQQAAYLLSVAMLSFMFGRFFSTWLMGRVNAQRLLLIYALINVALCAVVVLGFEGVSVVALVATFFFMSIMFPTLFAMGVKNLGPHTKRGSSFMIMAIVGGALLPYVMGLVADHSSTGVAYLLPMGCFVIVAAYARAALKKI